MKLFKWFSAGSAAVFVALLVPACGAPEPSTGSVELASSTKEIDIVPLEGTDLTCGEDVCFFVGSSKNISHVWVNAEGCADTDFTVTIDGHAAGPSDAGPPACKGFGGTRYVTGGRNPTDEYFDTVTVCVQFAQGVQPGAVSIQAKAANLCETGSVGSGECGACMPEACCEWWDEDCASGCYCDPR